MLRGWGEKGRQKKAKRPAHKLGQTRTHTGTNGGTLTHTHIHYTTVTHTAPHSLVATNTNRRQFWA